MARELKALVENEAEKKKKDDAGAAKAASEHPIVRAPVVDGVPEEPVAK